MKTFAEGVALLEAQDAIIEAAMEAKRHIRVEMIDKFCPVKLGDIVAVNHGHSYRGKRIKVSKLAVSIQSWRAPSGFVATGHVLKKDGTPGSCGAEHFSPPLKPE